MKLTGRPAHAALWIVGALLFACGSPQAAPGDQAPTPTPALTTGATSPDATAADTVPPTTVPTPTLRRLPPIGSKPGDTAPDFTLELDTGQAVSLASLRDQGRPVVLYFFTTW